jgi:hypothetical protein
MMVRVGGDDDDTVIVWCDRRGVVITTSVL